MYQLLLAVIYLAFISLGLPDSLLGAGWPIMHEQLHVPLSYAGAVTMLIACGTVISSLLADRLVRRVGTGVVTAGSVLLSALSLFGFSMAGEFWLLCVLALPYGLAAGAVDAVLNNYVALHFSGRHMVWLHCFWGVGAAVSPYLMGLCISAGSGWQSGYRLVFLIQLVIAAVVLSSLPLWKKRAAAGSLAADSISEPRKAGMRILFSLRGVKEVLLSFFCYCALETTTGLWASTYLAEKRGVAVEIAAQFGSLFYLGITCGRFLCGFITEKAGDKRMIRIGSAGVMAGIVLLMLPFFGSGSAVAGLLLVGFGCAPIYPCIIHATPDSFGKTHSQAIIGLQMASAYIGNTLMPPLFGVLAGALPGVGVSVYPYYLLLLGTVMVLLSERKNRICMRRVREG